MSQKIASIVMFISELGSVPDTLIVSMEYCICDVPDEIVDRMSSLSSEWSTYTMPMSDFIAIVWYPSQFDLDEVLFMLSQMLSDQITSDQISYWLNYPTRVTIAGVAF